MESLNLVSGLRISMKKKGDILISVDLLIYTCLVFLQFGVVVLGIPGLAFLRGIILGIAIILAIIILCYNLAKHKHTLINLYLLIIWIFAIIVGYFNGASITGIVLDSSIFAQIFLALAMLNKGLDNFERYLKFIMITSVVMTCIMLVFNPINLSVALNRGYIWTDSYYYTSLFWAFGVCVIYVTVFNKKPLWAYVYWMLAIILNLLFLKRMIFVDSAILLLIILYYKSVVKKGKRAIEFFRYVFAIVFLVINLFLISNVLLKLDLNALLSRVNERFGQVDTTGWVRYEESINFFLNADWYTLIIGSGFGIPHYGLEKDNINLHLGIPNFIHKFGILFLPFFLYYMFKAFINLINIRKIGKTRTFALLSTITFIVPLFFYGNNWVTVPSFGIMLLCLFIAAQSPKIKKG